MQIQDPANITRTQFQILIFIAAASYNYESSGFGRRRAHRNLSAGGSQNKIEINVDMQKIRMCYW